MCCSQLALPFYTSRDFGQTWSAYPGIWGWNMDSFPDAACSADGTRLVVAEIESYTSCSTDSGLTWTTGARNFDMIACSADGTKLVAAQAWGGQIYTSSDSGTSWTACGDGANWLSVASSADGSRLVAATWDGGLYTSEPTVVPPLPAPTFAGVADQVVDLAGPTGTPVAFNVTATTPGGCQPTVPVRCTPASGSTFPAGTNVVTCVAEDAYGLLYITNFTIAVRGTQAPTDIALSNSSLPENQPAGTLVGMLAAIDPEPGDHHCFALVAGAGDADNSLFAIVGNKLQTAAILNYEYSSTYSIRVRATDSGDLSVDKTFLITVTDTSDAPVLNVAKVPALDDIRIGAGAPIGPVGTAVTNLVKIGGPLSDASDDDLGAVTGIAIIGADASFGTWYYTTDGGTNWTNLGAPSDSSARLLAAEPGNRVYFQPQANFVGTVPGALSFRAWDQTVGVNGGVTDSTSNGWTTAFSAAVGAASQEVGWGNALQFDGINDYVNVGHGSNLDLGNTLTIEVLVKPNNLASRYGVFSTRLVNVAGAFQLEIGTGDLGVNRVAVSGLNTWVAQTANNAIQPNRWTHIAYTRSGTGANPHAIYINGVAQSLTTVAYTFATNTTDKVIGSGTSGTQLFPGQIDELRVWKVARTQAEITNSLLTTLSGNETGLVAYYRFDEGKGLTAYDATTNHSDGQLINGPVWVRSTVPISISSTNYILGNTRYVQGYQVNGVRADATAAVPNLVVGDLSGYIQPASGLAGIQLTDNNAAVNLRATYDGGDWGISTTGSNAAGILAKSGAADGGHGDNASLIPVDYYTSPGGAGRAAGSVTVASRGDIASGGTNAPGILAQSQAGTGGHGGNGDGTPASGGWGGAGGAGGQVVVQDNGGAISTLGNNSHGIFALSLGGAGGVGGESGTTSTHHGGHGGTGGDGGLANVAGSGNIATTGDNSSGILAVSQAGKGGNGGGGHGSASGGDGGNGGGGGAVGVDGSWAITTRGTNAAGISANSFGGGGGTSASGGWITGGGGAGGGSGDGGAANVTLGHGAGGEGGTIETFGKDSHGIFAQSVGGFAGSGGSGGSIFSSSGGDGGSAGNGGAVSIANSGEVRTHGPGADALFAESVGGGGGSSGSGSGLFGGVAGSAHAGGNGGGVTVNNSGEAYTYGANSRGIFAQSVGGGGGNSGYSVGQVAIGGVGGHGGIGSTVNVINSGEIGTEGADSSAIFAQSVGGGGGTGGGSSSVGLWGSVAIGGSGGGGGAGSGVDVTSSAQGVITTEGDRSHGIFAQSVGGGGGNGGFAGAAAVGAYAAAVAIGGTGGSGGSGSTVAVNSQGTISTSGKDAHGIFAQSVGGGGGSGGYSIACSSGLVASAALSLGGSGNTGGNGAAVSVTTGGQVQTTGDHSYGILAQSVGGGGGDGGLSVAGAAAGTVAAPLSLGGLGGGGGLGGSVAVNSQSEILTMGKDAHGIFAQSVGGGGGSGGFSVSGAISGGATLGAALGGKGGVGASASNVTVSTANTITTAGNHSYGILAQSVGGGGGDGGFSAVGAISGVASVNLGMGGKGGAGGVAGSVNVDTASSIATTGTNSHAIFAQSVGGGGGSGGFSAAAGISGSTAVSATMGGTGGSGADARNVTVNTTGATIQTGGDRSYGLLAQSIGGGGGDGGFNVAGNMGGDASVSLGLGGAAGVGGNGAGVAVTNRSAVSTGGDNAHGIFAQSVGGGGGSGGFSVAGNISGGTAVGANLGGAARGGGTGGNVSVNTSNSISTAGNHAYGILAQSIGGGGGDGGFSVAGGISSGPAVNLGLGGKGEPGGVGGNVQVASGSSINTTGANAHALFAQSVGGGGGSGGFSVAGGVSGGTAVSAALGGKGGTGADARNVTVTSSGAELQTQGDRSYGLLAQSVGGGGGDGGFSVAGGISSGPAVNFGMGGEGGVAGNGARVAVTNTSTITTHGQDAHGIFVQSVGGGGGSGGFSVAGGISSGASVSATIGGAAGGGGRAGDVALNTAGDISTSGEHAYGILAQSVGGGGGDGGFSVSGGISKGPTVNLGLGGSGGPGGASGAVAIEVAGSITTSGSNAHGIFAQSVGGGGGSGGFSVAGGLGLSAAVSASMGGQGGGGASASNVVLTSAAAINTSGDHSYGILAQSVGGGGGDGGFSFAGAVGKGPAIALSVGGNGSTGGLGRAVSVINTGAITTRGEASEGVFAQSVGGGGGSGGMAGNFAFDLNAALTNSKSVSLGASLGGSGGGGGSADAVTVSNVGTIVTLGNGSHGVMAQSVGGGGGSGGASVSLMSPFGTNSTDSVKINAAIGGQGGVGGSGSNVVVANAGSIQTSGRGAYGILAQSVGGGGGNGGDAEVKTLLLDLGQFGPGPHPLVETNKQSKSWDVGISVGVGGSGGAAGDGGKVSVSNTGSILTREEHSYGIFAQSIGGGGGNGGASSSDASSGGGNIGVNVTFGIGGNGKGGGSGDTVTVINQGTITNLGDASHGIVAQSVGGGGGIGGASVSTAGTAGTNSTVAVNLTAAVGGQGGVAGDGHQVSVVNGGRIYTSGEGSYGVLAQSIGGGGGDGGNAQVIVGSAGESGSPPPPADSGDTNKPSKSVSVDLNIGAGGTGGAGGSGGSVVVTNFGDIVTRSDRSHGIFAQSIGGGGGTGGASVVDSGAGEGDVAVTVNVGLGGKGGGGGSAKAVTVDNERTITTLGNASHGIVAQSIGGGGGVGGASVSTPASGGTGSNNSVSVSATIGGSGAVAGHGNNVLVQNAGQIATAGTGSYGILAQSIGGGGGDGGQAEVKAGGVQATNSVVRPMDEGGTNVPSKSWSVDVALGLGGTAGGGGSGGSVVVTNTGIIVTSNAQSHAILAQSVGGGGGVGGASATELAAADTDIGVTLNVGVGGKGGAGGSASAVLVNNQNTITTLGEASHGIAAQSIGGGGGMGGASVATPSSGGPAATVDLTATVGGSGGVGGSGSGVMVASQGTIKTSGEGSYGILAQSIGGGGGSGGLTQGPDSTATNWSLSVAVGGSGGTGGKGGAVTITNLGSITTMSNDSHGVLLQSIGGGGGNAGSAHSGQAQSFRNLNIMVGGNGGTGNDGGTVSMANAGLITTHGDGSIGVLAQSIGGGGGVGGTAGMGQSGTIGIGGSGGAAGDGAGVSITQAGNINTFGVAAQGVVAQSIGGGGGIAGNVDRGLGHGSLLGLAPAIARSGGSAGNGGAVSVATSGDILTRGSGANGIFAQSVGGGGGLAGDPGHGLSFAGSVGGAGSGGAVSVTHTGNITTLGDAAYGIFAQSAGGSNGFGGTVAVTLAGNVAAQGADSVGIFAQSVGMKGGSNITINIQSGSTIQGGTGLGVGVLIDGGANNTLINHGTITNASGSAGAAIVAGSGPKDPMRLYRVKVQASGTNVVRPQLSLSRGVAGKMLVRFSWVTNQTYGIEYTSDLRSGVWTTVPSPALTFPAPGIAQWADEGTLTGGNDTVQNYGNIVGSVDLGLGRNTFNNYLGATLDLGFMGCLNLGMGNALTNYGLLTGCGTIVGDVFDGSTFAPGNGAGGFTVDGSLNLLADACMSFDIGGRQQGNAYDFIRVTNFVSFLGTLSLSLDDNFRPTASDSFTLMEFSSSSGLFDNAVNGGRLATLDGSGSFRVSYTTNSLVLNDYQPGTNVLRITSLTPNASGQMVLQFSCVTNQIYVIESTTNLNSGVWTAVPSPVFTWPGPGIGQWVDEGTLTGGLKIPLRCYRVRLQLGTPP